MARSRVQNTIYVVQLSRAAVQSQPRHADSPLAGAVNSRL
jgi:hypothetical protein